jgi:peroxiredoxin
MRTVLVVDRSGGKTGPSYTVFLTAACVALAVLVVLLAVQNRSLKADVSEIQAQLAVAEIGRDKDLLEAGDTFPPLELTDSSGAPARLAFDGGGSLQTLLLVFSLDCPACQETIPQWEEVFAADDSPALDVVALRLDDLEAEPHHDVPLGIPVYDPVDPMSLPLERLVVPATLVVDAYGFVETAWYGMLSRTQTDELEELLFP